MKIAVLAHIRHAIAEPFRGGMEAHSHMLCRGLREQGHDVTLLAAAGSDDPYLIATCDPPYEDVLPFEEWHGTASLAAYQHRAFASAFDHLIEGDFDVVHNNSLFAPIIGWCAEAGLACVTSQHVPPFGDMRRIVGATIDAPGIAFTVTSAHQRQLWPAADRQAMTVVSNGVRTDRWHPAERIEPHFTWAGRIAPNKGTADAVQAARLAGIALKLFGPIEDAAYFAERVEPHLGGNIVYEGHQPYARLREEIRIARGALVTPRWDEPFGLVAAEALASGTPVIGFDRGALSGVVGDCGILVPDGDVAALADAIGRTGTIDRAACRARALERFSIAAMIAGYERCYASAMACTGTGGSPRATRASIRSSAQEALA